MTQLEGKHVLVAGLGKTGRAATRFFLQQGASVSVSESSPRNVLLPEFHAWLEKNSITCETGGHSTNLFTSVDLIFVSPGIPLNIKPLAEAKRLNIPVVGELAVAAQFLRTPVIAVTGTNGKTTTTTLLGGIFRSTGKNVFVEKPVVVNEEQLNELIRLHHAAIHSFNHSIPLMVGTNRRFSPMVKKLKEETGSGMPMQVNYRVNSGHIPTSSWLHNEEEGGGMLVGEMCHFIDVMVFLTNEKPVSVFARSLKNNNSSISDKDNVSITVEFSGGSAGTLNYSTVGDKSFSKERIEVFSSGKAAVLDDFRLLEISSNGRKKKIKARNQDKGQAEQLKQTVDGFRKGISPIPFSDIINVMKVIFAAKRSLAEGQVVSVISN